MYHLQRVFNEHDLCTCVSLVRLWTPGLGRFCLLPSVFSLLPSLHPLSPLFLILLLPFILSLLFSFLIYFVFHFIVICMVVSLAISVSFNVAGPESRITVDQLPRHPRYTLLSCRKRKSLNVSWDHKICSHIQKGT